MVLSFSVLKFQQCTTLFIQLMLFVQLDMVENEKKTFEIFNTPTHISLLRSST